MLACSLRGVYITLVFRTAQREGNRHHDWRARQALRGERFKPITLARLLELLKELVDTEEEILNAQLLELVTGLATAGYRTGDEDKFDVCLMSELGAEYIFSKMYASRNALWRYGSKRGFIYRSREEEAHALGERGKC